MKAQPLPGLTAEYFAWCAWWPPSQILESVMATVPWTGNNIQLGKRLMRDEEERRKRLPAEFCQCPRCRGWHWGLTHIDQLCESCEVMTAPYRYAVNKLGMSPELAWQHCLGTYPLKKG